MRVRESCTLASAAGLAHNTPRPPGNMNSHSTEQEGPVEATVSPYVAARPLRRYLGQHNRQALLLAFFSLTAAVLLWGGTYFFVYWFFLFTVTIIEGFNPDTLGQITQRNLVSDSYPMWFAVGVVAYLIVAAIIRRRYKPEKIREARFYVLWVLLELFMAVPNVTFSIWGNLRAITKLRKHDLAEAWRLLLRMSQEDGRLSLTSLRLEIDDERTLCRVVFALQIIGLVGMRESERGWFLYLQGQEVRTLLKQAA